MSSSLRWLGWTCVVALVALAVDLGRAAPGDAPRSSLPLRLLGPISSAAASVQWVRVRSAMRAGRPELVLARARLALELDPGATEGWIFLAGHLAFDRASAERGERPEQRAAWIRAALETAARGERAARDPARLALWQGLVLALCAQQDDPPAWPEGARGLWLEAALHFERAAGLGSSDGATLAANARQSAEQAR